MPFIPNTPESLLGRSDSKNPETTCRGITGSGRPCRRPLTSSPSNTPPVSRTRIDRLRADDPSDPNLYCWQHKGQASLSARSSPGPRTSTTPILETRESLDTLIDRLGIVEAQQQSPSRKNNGRKSGWQSVGEHKNEKISRPPGSSGHNAPAPRPPRKSKKEATFCFCFKIPIVEEERPARPKPRPLQAETPSTPPTAKLPSNQHLAPSPGARPGGADSPSSRKSSAYSVTSQYMALIPPSASPQTASQLMAELAKPISQQDEPGYIYIFWLTPESQAEAPPAEAARSLLAPPTRPDGGRQRRTSDVLQSFAANKTSDRSSSSSSKKTVLLKIGRASNVQRRLNEWKRQCGYDLSLIRYYPYISTSQPSTPRKMPHSHKVERLIHIELAGAGLRVSDRENCDACGRAHREWFEVDASRKGIEMVDEIVRRWSDWDERRG